VSHTWVIPSYLGRDWFGLRWRKCVVVFWTLYVVDGWSTFFPKFGLWSINLLIFYMHMLVLLTWCDHHHHQPIKLASNALFFLELKIEKPNSLVVFQYPFWPNYNFTVWNNQNLFIIVTTWCNTKVVIL
jgi:hypothetical protein